MRSRICMMVVFGFLAMMMLVTSEAAYAQESGQIPEVVLMGGQSNMCGRSETRGLTVSQRKIPANAEVHVNGKRLKSFADTRFFGPEVSFIRNLCKVNPDKQYIFIKYAVPGSSLYAWSPDWSCDEADITNDCALGSIYYDAYEAMKRAIGPRKVKFRAMIWMQGETDSRFKVAANAYYKNMKKLILATRRDLGTPDLLWILGLINCDHPQTARVIQAQLDIMKNLAGVYAIPTHGLTKLKDGVHYDHHGTWELGNRFAARYKLVEN